MEANGGCDIIHLDNDVLLPPRKRLLAGLKKQNSESKTHNNPQGVSNSNPLHGFESRINELMKSCNNGSSMTLEEIAEAARLAAVAAAKVAAAARAAAEEKSAIAAKAIAAAKSAMDLVASFSDESGVKEKKLKKDVPVPLVYKKNQHSENCRTDEELARRLHQVMNSSRRISKHSSGSDSKTPKHKKLKILPSIENDIIPDGVPLKEGKIPFECSKDNVARESNAEGSYEEIFLKVDDKASKSSTSDLIQENDTEAESSDMKEKLVDISDGTYTYDRKRGRIKQKKLSLSLFSFEESTNTGSSMSAIVTADKSTVNASPLPPAEPNADGILSTECGPSWKCQDFKVPQGIKQSKPVHS
ncbi:hypothetical protein AKJ16_DCAP05624 [Drosera capensis]